MSTPSEHAAFELGYKCCEKGMNLEAAFDMLNKISTPATIDTPLPKASIHSIPNGYELLEYLNSTIYDHRLEWVLEQLRALNVKHHDRDDLRIFPLWNSDSSVRLVLIGKDKTKPKDQNEKCKA
jgi:hypothetical protein